jgi:hypothetical protein
MGDEISYDGIDEAELVHALYHGTRPLGMGYLHNNERLAIEDVRAALANYNADKGRIHIDYFSGRPLKVTLNRETKTFSPRLYDRDAGTGEAARIVGELRRGAA